MLLEPTFSVGFHTSTTHRLGCTILLKNLKIVSLNLIFHLRLCRENSIQSSWNIWKFRFNSYASLNELLWFNTYLRPLDANGIVLEGDIDAVNEGNHSSVDGVHCMQSYSSAVAKVHRASLIGLAGQKSPRSYNTTLSQ